MAKAKGQKSWRGTGRCEAGVNCDIHVPAALRTGRSGSSMKRPSEHKHVGAVNGLAVSRGVHAESTGRSLENGNLISPDS